MAADESTPLLSNGNGKDDSKKQPVASWYHRALDVENRILLAGFLITLSFTYTQVP
jgi:hypothetical protein